MDRQFPQLSEGIEWNLVARRDLEGTQVNGNFLYPPQSFLIDSYVCQIGLRNPRSPGHWFLGGWASALLPFSPSSTTEFVSAVAVENRRLRLGVLNLFIVPKLIKPWILEIKFPRWHEQMYLEVWQYDGEDIDLFQRIDQLQPTIPDGDM
ncbi:hypothetical protein [Egbenema bharatensis]|uniref:hypothetical protein n=1 Tax=Egbenema bharatensis TaxID=3463334 RepID=UPI003A8555E9